MSFLYLFENKISYIPLAKRKKRLAKKKAKHQIQRTNNPKSRPISLITKGTKRHAKGKAPNEPLPSKI